MDIKKLKRDAIDDDKWDKCVRQSSNGVVFAFTWYLDISCDEWEGIILNDYDAIIPLPIKQHFVINNYVALPHWIPHLGVINKNPISNDETLDLLNQVPYLNVTLTLNAHNKLPEKVAAQLKHVRYHVLDLILSLEKMEHRFLPEIKALMQLYHEKQITVIRSLNPKEYCDFLRQENDLSDKKVDTLIKLISFALRYKSAGTYAAYNVHNEMIAEAFIVKSNSCLSLINYASRSDDTELLGPKAIIYHVLKHNAESNLTFEFPFNPELGRCFCQEKHVCYQYRKGWLYFLGSLPSM